MNSFRRFRFVFFFLFSFFFVFFLFLFSSYPYQIPFSDGVNLRSFFVNFCSFAFTFDLL